MLKINENNQEDDIWLHRYMSFESFKFWFSNELKMNLCFSKIQTFDDIFEGLMLDDSEIKNYMDLMLKFEERALNDGGIVELNEFSLIRLIGSKPQEVEETLIKHRKLVTENFASCWFINNDVNFESRYMWKLYGGEDNNYTKLEDNLFEQIKNPNGDIIKKLAFKLSIKWEDIKPCLQESNYSFQAGLINYSTESTEPLFTKHNSYSHEKEFRILTQEIKETINGDYQSLLIDIPPSATITFNRPLTENEQTELKEFNTNQIHTTNLPSSIIIKDLITNYIPDIKE